ncbi:MAG TPA: helix-turn-helix transcriptional regulator [Sandaracinaceae bacterium LLY-WYZ-13_1]|nr:helix-turn-helix transcriptional regulator [Sandaracinaceae bacterium LLY-WYZ-13_1]
MTTQPPPLPPAEELDRIERVFMQRLGARIRELRLARGYTLLDLTETHGLSKTWLSQAENGQEAVTARSAVRLAIAFDVEPYELYLEPAAEPPPRAERKQPIPEALPRTALTHRVAEFRAQIGRRIYDLRTIQGMSLDMIAELTGLDRKQLGFIEAGTSDSAHSIVRIADAIGVMPHELYLPRDQSGIREKKPSRRKRRRGA